MTSVAGLASARADPPALGWRGRLALLGFAIGGLLYLYRSDFGGIVATWTRTGAFHHCFLLPPIVLWLIWQRRANVLAAPPGYSGVGLAIIALGGLLWLAGAAAFVALLRQAGLVIMAEGLVIAFIGMRATWLLRFPLAFALFLIPAGSEFEPWLQLITARIAVALLHIFGTSATLEGVFVDTSVGLFRVAEACSGTAFLLAMAAYATLVAALCFETMRRRAAFLAVAMVVALLGNGVRAFAIMALANHSGMANPIVQDHLLYGWLLFALLIVLLMIGAGRWFDRAPDAPFSTETPRWTKQRSFLPPMVILPLAVALLIVPPVWFVGTEPPRDAPSPPPVAPVVRGWHVTAGTDRPDWRPHYAGATWIGQWRYVRDGGGPGGLAGTVDIAIVRFDRQEEGRELVGFDQGATVAGGAWSMMARSDAPAGGGGAWLRGEDGQRRYVATWYLLGDTVTGSRIGAAGAAVRQRLTGGDPRAVAVLLSAPDARLVAAMIDQQNSPQELADRAGVMR